MNTKKNRLIKKIFAVMTIICMLVLDVPVLPRQMAVNNTVEAKTLAKGVTEQDIIDSALKIINSGKFSYSSVGTCTGFVTRVLNSVGITAVVGDYNTVPGFPRDSWYTPWADGSAYCGGAKKAPLGMWNDANGSESEYCEEIWHGFKSEAVNYAYLFKTGDLVLTRPVDKKDYDGNGHAALMYVDGNHLKMFEAVTVGGPTITDLGVGSGLKTAGIDPHGSTDPSDTIWVYRLFESSYKLKIQKTVDTSNVVSETVKNSSPEGCQYTIYKNEGLSDVEEVLTVDASGNATSKDLSASEYWVKETYAPAGYTIDKTVYHVTSEQAVDGEVVIKSKDSPKAVRASVNKEDIVTVHSQGDATLEGAQYGLYSDSDCTKLIDTTTTDEDGQATFSKLVDASGRYYIKEIKPSVGYTLDTKVYPVECTDLQNAGDTTDKVITSKEKVMLGSLTVSKYDDVPGSSEENVAVGAVLRLTLKSDHSITMTATIGEDGKATFFYDVNAAYAPYTIPYGEYEITEDSGSKDGGHTHYYIQPETVIISKDSDAQYRAEADMSIPMHLKVYKTNKKTGEVVKLAGAEFQIWDCQKNDWVRQMQTPGGDTIQKYVTNSEGYFITPQELYPGDYVVYETKAPEHYYLNDDWRIPSENVGTVGGKKITLDKVGVKIKEDEAYPEGGVDVGDLIYEVNMPDELRKVQLEVYKTGEKLSNSTTEPTDYGDKYVPTYKVEGLANVVFDVIADETKEYPGGESITKGVKYDTIRTNDDGIATTQELLPGKYVLKEVETPLGYVPEDDLSVDLKNEDPEKRVELTKKTINNQKQDLKLTFKKEWEKLDYVAEDDEETRWAEFGVYTRDDVRNSEGRVVIPRDSLVDIIKIQGEEVDVTSNYGMPGGKYYVKELDASAPYTIDKTKVVDVTLEYNGKNQKVVTIPLNSKWVNTFDKASITLIKVSSSSLGSVVVKENEVNNVDKDEVLADMLAHIQELNGDEEAIKKYLKESNKIALPSAEYTVYLDEACTNLLYKVDETTGEKTPVVLVTDESGLIKVDGLPVNTYYLKETKAPKGYQPAKEPIKIVLTRENKDQTVYNALIEDSELGEVIDKSDIFTGDKVPNCEFVITDENGTELLHSITDDKGNADIVTDIFEEGKTYKFKELKAPEEYDLNPEEHEFVAHFDEEEHWIPQDVEVVNVRKSKKLVVRKTDDETGEPLQGCKFSIILLDEDGNPYVNDKGENVYLVENAVTDENGEYTVDKAYYGTYKFIEVEAPEGYEKNEEAMENYVFTINDDSADTIIFEVTNTGDIAVYALIGIALISVIGIVYISKRKIGLSK